MTRKYFGTDKITSPLRGEVAGEKAPAGGGDKPYTSHAIGIAKALRKNLTDAEKRLWKSLRREQLGVKFRRQQPLGRYIADFACMEKKLVIELDGGQHDQQRSHDMERDAYIRKEDYRVLRFWNNEINENMAGVLETIMRALIEQHPHQKSGQQVGSDFLPPPSRGRQTENV